MGALGGLALGMMMDIFVGGEINEVFSLSAFVLEIAFLIIGFMLGFIIHIVVHEAGHLIAGLLSGYEFISFRIGTLTLIKEAGCFKWKKFSVQGTAGQCLMMPPSVNPKHCPYILYNLGGILINLLLSVVSLCLVLFFPLPKFLASFGVLLMFTGILCVLMNGIPLKIGGSPNDGFNVLEISRQLNSRYAFYSQLRCIGLIHQGVRPKDLSLDCFELPNPSSDYTALVLGLKGLEASYYQDRHEFVKAREIFEEILSSVEDIPLYRYEAQCELLFYELMGECREEVLQTYQSKELKQYVKAMKTHISKKRLLIAHALMVENNEEKANELMKEFERVARQYPAQAEVESERELIAFIKEQWRLKYSKA